MVFNKATIHRSFLRFSWLLIIYEEEKYSSLLENVLAKVKASDGRHLIIHKLRALSFSSSI